MDNSLLMMTAVSPMLTMLGAFTVLGGPLTLYAIARWRNRDVGDPQLGVKVVLGYFAATALQALLVGATLLVYAMVSGESSASTGSIYRAAFGLLIPAALVYAVHVVMLRRTNQAVFPGVARLLRGYNLVIVAVVGFGALIVAFQAAFGKGSAGEVGKGSGAAVVVYGAAWIVLGWQLMREGFGGSGHPRIEVAAPAEPEPRVPVGLPPLGGGVYPPLEK